MIYTVTEYQHLAQRTSKYAPGQKIEADPKLVNGIIGLNGEAGEVADILKKHLFQGHELNREKLIDELGDVLWYIAETAEALGVSLETIMEHNIDKLRTRYPEGFNSDRSINRPEYTERCESGLTDE